MSGEICDKCGKLCKNKKNLWGHRQTDTCAKMAAIRTRMKLLTCPFCGWRERTIESTNIHKKNCISRRKLKQYEKELKAAMQEIEYLKTIVYLQAIKIGLMEQDESTYSDGSYLTCLKQIEN